MPQLKHAIWVNLWPCERVCVCVTVCVWLCVHACARDTKREKERERKQLFETKYAHWHCDRKNRWKMWTFFMFLCLRSLQVRKSFIIQVQHKILQLHQEILLWNSVQRSQRHMQQPELKAQKQPTLIMKLHWGVSTTSFELALDLQHFENMLLMQGMHAHFIFWQAQALLLSDRLSSASSAQLRFNRAQLSV